METSDSNSKFSNTLSNTNSAETLLSNVLQVKNEQSKSQLKGKLRRCKKCRKTFKNYSTFLSHTKLHNNTRHHRNKQAAKNALLFQQHQDFHCKTCSTTCTGVAAFLEHMKGHSQPHEATYGTLPTDDQQQEVVVSSIQIPQIQNEEEHVQQHVTIEG